MVRIVTDSTANLSAELAAENGITVVPLQVQIGDETFQDGINLTQAEFLRLLPNADPLPTTSQPSPLTFEETYREILDQGDEVLSIHLSSDLSGTLNSARNGMLAFEDAPITIVDSRSTSLGLGMLVLAAADMLRAGSSREEVAERIREMAKDVLLVITVETMEYLKRGGRIGGAQAFLGGLLRIKPVIVIRDGRLEPGERARSRKKAVAQIIAMQVERFGNQPVWLAVAHAEADDAEEVERLAKEALNVTRTLTGEIGPVIATHTGPGVVGIACVPDPSQ